MKKLAIFSLLFAGIGALFLPGYTPTANGQNGQILPVSNYSRTLLPLADASSWKTLLATPTLTNNTTTPTAALSVISKQKSSSVGLIEVSPSDAAAINSGWQAYFTQFTLTLSPSDASFGGNGIKIFIGMSGNQVQFFTGVGGSSSQVAATGTVQLYRPTAYVPYAPGYGGLNTQLLAGSFLSGSQTDATDYTGVSLSDCYIRPSSEPITALTIGRPNGSGADTGFIFITGKRGVSAHQWLSDGHTLKRYSNGGQSHNDNSYALWRQPFYEQFWVSQGAYANGGAYLAANPSMTFTGTLSQRQIADGVYQIAGSSSTDPASLALPIRAVTLAASQNDYSPGVGSNQEWTGAGGGSTVTGLLAGSPGEIREIWVLSNTITFSNQSASSAAANRFTTNTGADIAAAAGSVIRLVYKNSTVGWRVYKAS